MLRLDLSMPRLQKSPIVCPFQTPQCGTSRGHSMSLRAELLRLSLKAVKVVQGARKRRTRPGASHRRRLALIEPIVPRPPAGTKTTIIDVDGINAVETQVRGARTDRCVLYFHGGGYAFGTAPLVRDFTWRLGA